MKITRNRSLESLLDRQARLWQAERVEHPPPEAPTRSNITISQRPWSGGEHLAVAIADRLGWELYDRAIVSALHENDALGRSVLEALDERLLGFREDWLYHLFVPGHTLATNYVRRLSEFVFSIAMRGNNVFLGRCACFIVPPEWRLAVLVTREFESRVARCMADTDLGHEAARREVARVDRIRAEFATHGFRRSIDDPASHELCLDLDRWSLEDATEIVHRALSLRFPSAVAAHVG